MTPLEKLLALVRKRVGVRLLLRGAILCTLGSLAVMLLMTFLPIPLLVVVGMGAAHGLGILGVVGFTAAVLVESVSSQPRPSIPSALPPEEPPAPNQSSE